MLYVKYTIAYDREETSSFYTFEPDSNGKYRCGSMVGELFYE